MENPIYRFSPKINGHFKMHLTRSPVINPRFAHQVLSHCVWSSGSILLNNGIICIVQTCSGSGESNEGKLPLQIKSIKGEKAKHIFSSKSIDPILLLVNLDFKL